MKLIPPKPLLRSLTVLATLVAPLGLVQIPAWGQSTSLMISVAASFQDAMKAVQPLYEQISPDVELVFNFGSSGSLQRQIAHGAPVDLFISAAARHMDALDEQGLIQSATRTILVINELVLITPLTGPSLETPQDLMKAEIQQIAIGEPTSVPAGSYAYQALTAFDLIPNLESKFVLGKDVRQVLNYVETGNVEAGIVYQTDAWLSDHVQIALTFPSETHDPIVYPMAVTKESPDPEAAEAFAQFLQGEVAQRIFTQFGFKPPRDLAKSWDHQIF